MRWSSLIPARTPSTQLTGVAVGDGDNVGLAVADGEARGLPAVGPQLPTRTATSIAQATEASRGVIFGILVFIFAAKASPAGYLILLCCLIAAIAVGMVAAMRRNNPPHARP